MADGPVTQLGSLDFKLAMAACYVPIMGISLIVPILFLVMEPKEHEPVRYHALQALACTVGGLLAMIVLMLGAVFVPVVFIVGAAVAGGAVGDLLLLFGTVLQLFASFAMTALMMLGPMGMLGMCAACAMGMDPRLPGGPKLAARLTG